MKTVRQRGVTLIEVLIAIVVTVIGLLGMVALQMRAYATEAESYQRAQAAVLLEDMAHRIRANGKNAADYEADDVGVGAVESCGALTTIAERDLCEWGNLLRGAAEVYEGSNVGALIAGRGCIVKADETVELYSITVVWQGSIETAPPGADCGKDAYSSEGVRRALSTVVRIPNLGS